MASSSTVPSLNNGSNRNPLNLRFLVLNAENLFLLSDQSLTHEHTQLDETQWQRLSTSIYDNKSLFKLAGLARVFRDVQPDIVMLSEVGGLESLVNFNKLFLQDQYSPALIEGNSKRNIDVGFLVRKGLPFFFDVVSNKNRPINFNYAHQQDTPGVASEKFSRDVAELHLFAKDRDKPFLIALLAHLKSRLDPDNIDTNGFYRRQAEMAALLDVFTELNTKHQEKIPFVIAGDFNGHAALPTPDPEFRQIYERTKWLDICELAQVQTTDRATYYQIARNSRVDGRQIDFAFLSQTAQNLLNKSSVQVYRYKDPRGLPADPPTTLDAKMLLPSDHYPLVFELQAVPTVDLMPEGK